jgi:hypothetical protein
MKELLARIRVSCWQMRFGREPSPEDLLIRRVMKRIHYGRELSPEDLERLLDRQPMCFRCANAVNGLNPCFVICLPRGKSIEVYRWCDDYKPSQK